MRIALVVCRVVCTLSLVTELSASCRSLMQNVSVTRADGKYTGDQLRRHVVSRNATTFQSSDDQSPIRQAVIRCPTRAVIGKMKVERSHRGKFAGGSRGRDGGRYVGGTRGRLTSRRQKRTAVTQLNRGDLLHAFNQMRRTVSPLASNMLFMVWSAQLETLAHQWASRCEWSRGQPNSTNFTLGHRELGQTIWAGNVSDAERQMQDAINAWKDEKSYFFYKNMFDFCADQNCANYMQIIWATSQYVGCSLASCKPLQRTYHTTQPATFVVCYFVESRTYGGRPYIQHYDWCSRCPGTHPQCFYGLCTAVPRCQPVTDCPQSDLINSTNCLCSESVHQSGLAAADATNTSASSKRHPAGNGTCIITVIVIVVNVISCSVCSLP